MRFEKVREIKNDNKIVKLIEDFIRTNYDRVEIINEDASNDRCGGVMKTKSIVNLHWEGEALSF